MTPTDKQKFDQAVALAQAGRNQEAYNILGQLAPSNPDDSNIMLWMAFTASDPAKARLMLGKVAMLDPDNPALPGARNWLAAQEKKLTPVAAAKPVVAAATAAQTSPEPATTPAPAARLKPEVEVSTPKPKAAPAKKPKTRSQSRNARALRLGLMLGGGLIVVFLIYLGLLLIGLIGGVNTDSLEVPSYTGGTRLDLGKTDQDGVIGGLNLKSSSFTNRVSFDTYVIKNNDKNKALDFYNNEMKNRGWLVSPRFNSPTLSREAFLKASRTVVVGLTSGTNLPPSVLSKMKPDESLLIVIVTQLENVTPTPRK